MSNVIGKVNVGVLGAFTPYNIKNTNLRASKSQGQR